MDLDDDELIATRDGGICEFCNEGKPLITIERLDHTFDYNIYNTFIWQNELIVLSKEEQCLDTEEKCKINYCPMCGKKLE